jgi:hypothetical protein
MPSLRLRIDEQSMPSLRLRGGADGGAGGLVCISLNPFLFFILWNTGICRFPYIIHANLYKLVSLSRDSRAVVSAATHVLSALTRVS